MKAQIVEQVELFTEAELESLEFVPEELEAIEEERVPDLESISFEEIAEDLEAVSEQYLEAATPISALYDNLDHVRYSQDPNVRKLRKVKNKLKKVLIPLTHDRKRHSTRIMFLTRHMMSLNKLLDEMTRIYQRNQSPRRSGIGSSRSGGASS